MLTVTDSAAQLLSEAMSSRDEETAEMIRIAFIDGEYSLTLDEPREDDAVIEHQSQGLLILDPEVSEALSDFTLDAQETAKGPCLSLTRG